MSKISSIYGRIPTSLKKRFLVALNKARTSQQMYLVDCVNDLIKKTSQK